MSFRFRSSSYYFRLSHKCSCFRSKREMFLTMDGEIETDACIPSIPYAMETIITKIHSDHLLRI